MYIMCEIVSACLTKTADQFPTPWSDSMLTGCMERDTPPEVLVPQATRANVPPSAANGSHVAVFAVMSREEPSNT